MLTPQPGGSGSAYPLIPPGDFILPIGSGYPEITLIKQNDIKFIIMPLWWYLIFQGRQPAPPVLIVINSHVLTARYRASKSAMSISQKSLQAPHQENPDE